MICSNVVMQSKLAGNVSFRPTIIYHIQCTIASAIKANGGSCTTLYIIICVAFLSMISTVLSSVCYAYITNSLSIKYKPSHSDSHDSTPV
jgi:hypothetical protein